MGDIAQRGNRLTKKHISKDLVRNVYDAVAPKHSPGQKGKPHSSKEGRAASFGRTVRDVGKILSPERVKKFGGGRTNLLEELGRVEAEPSNRNRRAEISRVHGELNRGYARGGKVGKPKWPSKVSSESLVIGTGGPRDKNKLKFKKEEHPAARAKGGRVGLKKGGKPWGTGPKPGSHEFLMQNLHKRKGKAIGGVLKTIKRALAKPKGPKKPKSRDSETHGKDVRTMAAEGGRIGLKKGGSDKKWMQKVSASIKKRGTKGKCTPITKPGCTGRAKALAKTFKKMAAKRKA